ncbi:MAG: FtsX-like permease family protein [Bacteroidota bacterium]
MLDKTKGQLKILYWIFSRITSQSYVEELLGDLEEIYEERLHNRGKWYASFMLWFDAFHLMFSFSSIRKLKAQSVQLAMIKNYFKIAYRNMLRYKFYSAINVIGLSIGISMSLLIAIHVHNELGYETSYPKQKLIYRLASTNYAAKSPILGLEFKEKMPEVKEMARIFSFNPVVISHGTEDQMIQRPFLADHSMINMFDLEFIEGNKEDALKKPSSIILTESVANRLFKQGEKRIGEVVDFDDGWRQTVTGIIKDFPQNTHLKIDCISSMERTHIGISKDRLWAAVSVYVLFNSEEDVESARDKLMDFHVQFFEGMASAEQIKKDIIEAGEYLELHPINDIHLHSHRQKEFEANSNVMFIYVFSALALFILSVVIINFINLYVAQTLNRIKEIGLRKTLGAYRNQLVFQFLSEAFFLVLISGVLAILFAYMALPFYNQLALIPIAASDLFSISVLISLAILIVIVATLAGGYPAFYLSRFGILEGLSSKGFKISNKLPLRTAMVAFQFLISICLLSATLIVNEQMSFIEAKDMGFAKEEVIAIQLHRDLKIEGILYPEKLKSELKKLPSVEELSFSSHLIGSRFSLEPSYLKSNPEDLIPSKVIVADPSFLETMGVELIRGNQAQKGFSGKKYFLNETAANLFQHEDVLGETVVNSWIKKEGEIIGIVKDFHYASLHNPVDPLIIELSNDQNAIYYLLIRTKTNNIASAIEDIEETLLEIAPGSLILPLMVDEHMDLSYRAENNMFSIFKFFSIVIIGLACIGLFALFAFVAQTRTKEMGIRKILGATMPQLLMILSKSYLIILVIIAVLAAPMVQIVASKWLDSFAFRAAISTWSYIIPGCVILVLASFAIYVQSWKVVKTNPVESLRNE